MTESDPLREAFEQWLSKVFVGKPLSAHVQELIWKGWIVAEAIGVERGKVQAREDLAVKPSRFKKKKEKVDEKVRQKEIEDNVLEVFADLLKDNPD